MDWHAKTVDEVPPSLETGKDGLSQEEAGKRLEENGPNTIDSGDEVNPVKILIDQFRDFLIYILVFAAILSLGVGYIPFLDAEPRFTEAFLIIGLVIADGVLGFIQEYRAESSIKALKDMSTPDATVLRDGKKVTVDSKEVVPGDIIFIEQGDSIPADARLIETSSLETDESALTGESTQVSKDTEAVDSDTPLAERTDMVFKNTTAVRGRGKAVVTETGMDTEVGDIANEIEDADDEMTAFQKEVNQVGKVTGYLIMAIIAIVAIVQYFFTGASIVTIILVAVSLAVAAVPEALPLIVTIALVLGSKKILKKDALVRRLPVVETLGSVDYIVTDKTGTLTEDRMTVEKVYASGKTFEVTGDVTGEGKFLYNGEEAERESFEDMLRCGYICNNAEEAPETEEKDYFGDPTEIALIVSAKKAEVTPETEKKREIPFTSSRKRMTVVTDEGKAYMKGAPGKILEKCDRIKEDGEITQLTEEKKEEIRQKNQEFASEALRVLAMAEKEVEDADAGEEEIESDMVFLGLQGMIDPPRSEVPDAVEDCRNAGINVLMATGDNKETAKAIGEQVGFNPDGALEGADIENMSNEELEEAVENTEIFSRVSPKHKVDILESLQEQGRRVAMTGDGVNDAPALKDADVGISMGQRGTDVAQQSSDMVLQDDNFVTIRDAIAEGRAIFDNIRKFVSYILSYNVGEVLVVFLGTLIGTWFFPEVFSTGEGVIITAVMLLWVNLVTDGPPAIALGFDPKMPDIMKRPPRGTDEPIIDKRMLGMMAGLGTLTAVGILPLFFLTLMQGASLVIAQTMVFTGLALYEMMGVQTVRHSYGASILSNRYVLYAIGFTITAQAAVLYIPPLASMFGAVPLGMKYVEEIVGSVILFGLGSAAIDITLNALFKSRTEFERTG